MKKIFSFVGSIFRVVYDICYSILFLPCEEDEVENEDGAGGERELCRSSAGYPKWSFDPVTKDLRAVCVGEKLGLGSVLVYAYNRDEAVKLFRQAGYDAK